MKAARLAGRGQFLISSFFLFNILYARLRYGIGPRYYSLFRINSVPVSELGGFILDSESNPILRHINKDNIPLAVNKLLFAAHCLKNCLPTIPVLFVVQRDGVSVETGFPCILNELQFMRALENAPDHLFVKVINGAHGEGAFTVDRGRDGWVYCDQIGSDKDLAQFCLRRAKTTRGLIVQPKIRPHSTLSGIMPNGSMGTVRAVTYLSEAGPKVILPLLRIPAGGNFTDNFSEGRSGNLVTAIDIKTGVLGIGKMSRTKLWPEIVEVDRHPDTDSQILGLRLPYWPETLELMLKGQSSTPQLRTIGWDIAITEDGPVIVEANTGYDANLLQFAYGRGIRADLAEILLMRNG